MSKREKVAAGNTTMLKQQSPPSETSATFLNDHQQCFEKGQEDVVEEKDDL